MTAVRVDVVPGFTDGVLWRIGGQYVVTSRVANSLTVETYAFKADVDGRVTNWEELPGSLKGRATHEEVIALVEEYGDYGRCLPSWCRVGGSL